jgi:hypothetical protein
MKNLKKSIHDIYNGFTIFYEGEILNLKDKEKFISLSVDVCCKMMSSLVVLMMKNELHESFKTLEAFFQIHRIFIYLLKRYPQLQICINNKLKKFNSNADERSKNIIPSMGDFLSLLIVSDELGWNDLKS